MTSLQSEKNETNFVTTAGFFSPILQLQEQQIFRNLGGVLMLMLLLRKHKDDRGYNNGRFYYPGEAKAKGIGAIDVRTYKLRE